MANVLYLESPIGVGFSYDTTQDNFSNASDWQSAWQNYNALTDFFTKYWDLFSGTISLISVSSQNTPIGPSSSLVNPTLEFIFQC